MSIQIEALGVGSIQDINALPADVCAAFYARLIPDELLTLLGVDREALTGPRGPQWLRVTAPGGEPWARVEVRASQEDRDPILLVDVEMSPLSMPDLAFVQINDPASPRYAIDRDPDGQDTLYGTVSRNLAEEARALAAGLAPGQVRRGLRLLRPVLHSMDEFCRLLNKHFYLIDPLFYHSAILYERGGCGYLMGRDQMEEIHRGFAEDGSLTRLLDGSTPFRQPGFEKTVRGRSWAIADGILGAPFGGVKMYRAPGRSANVRTFPEGVY